MTKNQFVAEKLGRCWHDIQDHHGTEKYGLGSCSKCGETFTAIHFSDWSHEACNPDFTTDAGAVELLRLMMKREDWKQFHRELRGAMIWDEIREAHIYFSIDVLYITTPGALLDAVADYFGWKEERK